MRCWVMKMKKALRVVARQMLPEKWICGSIVIRVRVRALRAWDFAVTVSLVIAGNKQHRRALLIARHMSLEKFTLSTRRGYNEEAWWYAHSPSILQGWCTDLLIVDSMRHRSLQLLEVSNHLHVVISVPTSLSGLYDIQWVPVLPQKFYIYYYICNFYKQEQILSLCNKFTPPHRMSVRLCSSPGA